MKTRFKFRNLLRTFLNLFGFQLDKEQNSTAASTSNSDIDAPNTNTDPIKVDGSFGTVPPEQCQLHRMEWPELINFTQSIVNDPVLRSLVRNVSFGGLFSTETLKNLAFSKIDTIMDGFSGWWCWGAQAPNSAPVLFIALEPLTSYNTSQVPNYPTATSLYISRNVFTYPDPIVSHADFIRNHTTKTIYPDQDIELELINEFIDAFRSSFPVNLPDGGRHNQYSVAFFRNDAVCKTLIDFLDQFGSYKFPYVRYYFGLDNSNQRNKLRLILVPVDEDGKNIHINGNQQAHYLQHTFP